MNHKYKEYMYLRVSPTPGVHIVYLMLSHLLKTRTWDLAYIAFNSDRNQLCKLKYKLRFTQINFVPVAHFSMCKQHKYQVYSETLKENLNSS